jgi:hypothetical protein
MENYAEDEGMNPHRRETEEFIRKKTVLIEIEQTARRSRHNVTGRSEGLKWWNRKKRKRSGMDVGQLVVENKYSVKQLSICNSGIAHASRPTCFLNLKMRVWVISREGTIPFSCFWPTLSSGSVEKLPFSSNQTRRRLNFVSRTV